MTKLLRAAALVVLVAAALTAWFVLRLREGPGLPSGSLELPGLREPVEVLYDTLGIPQIWARREEDLVMAQGWVTARDRLWQMEMLRRVAEGRLSEIFGEATLETDRFLRTIGMARAATRTREALDSATLRHVEAYVAGVNAAIAGWSGPLPPEFVVLRFRPEPWTVSQALAIEKVMAWDLAEYQIGLSLAEARRAGGEDVLDLVRPRYPAWGPTIVEGAPPAVGGPGGDTDPATDLPDPQDGTGRGGLPTLDSVLIASARPPERAVPFLEAGSVVRASNSWVVGPERSASGRPLLANDMHLALNQPTLWYLVGLHGPDVDVVGMSLPGTPWVVAGHTAGVAWGFTNAALDDVDFFVERVDPEDPGRYLTPDGSAPFRAWTEDITVRGRDEPVSHLVRDTRHGPVVSGDGGGEELLAMRWVAHDASRTLRALVGMNRAGSVEELVAALPDFTNPHQNVVFADTAGRWGYWMAGTIPRRSGGRPPVLPVPGWTGEHDWGGPLPFAEHPHVLEPAEGFLVTANNRQTTGAVSELVTDGTWAPPYRAMAIRSLLESGGTHDAASLQAIQLDVGSAFAERHLRAAVSAFRAAGQEQAAGRLEAWDVRAPVESVPATLFYAWIEALRESLREDAYAGEGGYMPLAAVERALEAGRVTAGEAAEAARTALTRADGRSWGEAHRLDLGHPLADAPVVGRLLGFGRADIPREGQPHSVNVAGYRGSTPPFRVTHGPSQRHVVDLGDLDGAGGFVLPGGQSGWPRSARASDQLARWRAGTLVRVPMSRPAVEARTVARLRLDPVRD